MRKWQVVISASVAALMAFALASAGVAAPPPSKQQALKQYSPAQLQALAATPGSATVPTSGQAQQVSAASVLDAAAQPGAVVEKAPGLTDIQATGAAPTVGGAVSSTDAVAAASPVCWHQTFSYRWGTWPQFQDVFENRDWCGYLGGEQTYRVSNVNGGTFTCDWNQAYEYKVSGGNGYTWTVVRSGAHFSCPTGIPWINLHFDHWMEWSANTWGNYSFVNASG